MGLEEELDQRQDPGPFNLRNELGNRSVSFDIDHIQRVQNFGVLSANFKWTPDNDDKINVQRYIDAAACDLKVEGLEHKFIVQAELFVQKTNIVGVPEHWAVQVGICDTTNNRYHFIFATGLHPWQAEGKSQPELISNKLEMLNKIALEELELHPSDPKIAICKIQDAFISMFGDGISLGEAYH